jgi:outer membrane protein OmpA-like peptidoglycan-associated protein
VGNLDFPVGNLNFPSGLFQTETTSTIEVELSSDVLFDFDKADIRPEAATALQEVGLLIREKSRGSVAIHGYTDSKGSDSYNQKLSERRAESVRAWLVTRENLGSVKFKTVGFGAKNPVAPNSKLDGSDDPDGRQLNRRVTIVIQK